MHEINEGLIKSGRIFYGVCVAGLGIQQLFYGEFRPVVLPPWPSSIPGLALCAYLAGAALIGAGVAIVIDRRAREVALVLGGILLALVCLCHVPYEVLVDPYSNHLGTWTNPFKALALSGGAFVAAGSLPRTRDHSSSLMALLERFVPLGRILFSITMITFGIDHFLYVEVVAALVPAWIPGHVFWTYFAAVALIGSGAAIILNIKLKAIGILLGAMIFLWFILLHIPRAIADPFVNKGNEVTSVFEALGFSGIAFVLAYGVQPRKRVRTG